MKNCANCKHSFTMDICWFCHINIREIPHPHFMGGPKKCQCYEEMQRKDYAFRYPTKEELK